MRKILLFFTLLIYLGQSYSQVMVNLQQPPPNQLGAADLWKVTLINSGKSIIRIRINGTLEAAGQGIVVEGNSGILNLPPGIKRISYDDVKSGDVHFKSGIWQAVFTRTGNAPSGDYTICIHVKDESGAEIGSSCIDQSVEIESVPVLNAPADEGTITAGQAAVFTWIPPTPAPPEPVTYNFKIVELLSNQSPDVALQRNHPWYEKTNIRTTMFQYPVSARNFVIGKQYAWTVQSINQQGQPVGANNGMAAPFTFSAGGNNGGLRMLTVNNPDSSGSTGGGTGTAATGDTIKAGHDGEFNVIVSQVTTEADSSLTGKGKVRIGWLKTYVAVEFKKIKIDTSRRLISGGIEASQSDSTGNSALTYPKAWALSLLSGPGVANVVDNTVHWTNNQVNSLIGWVNNMSPGSQPLINYNSSIPPPSIPNNALKMPFGLQFENGNDQLVITEMIFESDESKVNFLAEKDFTKSGTDYSLGFAGKYFKIHPNSIDFSSGRVELVEDFPIPSTSANPKMKFIFKEGTDTSGCYAEWDSTGITEVNIGLDIKFSRDWLLPVPTSTDTVTATFSGNGTSLHDILLTGVIPHCEIVGTNGLKIQADSIFLDLSDIRNPDGMYFPKNYTNDTTAQGRLLWQGLYIKSFGLTLPETWKTGANPTQINASDLIIDDYGVTMKLTAANIITFSSCKVANLSASLDTLNVSMLKGSLTDASAKGLIVLPISKDTITNTLKYTATFSQASGADSLQIVITPLGPIDADILKGKLTLDPTSNITAAISSNTKTLSIALNGKFNWDSPDLSAPVSNIIGSPATRLLGIKGIKMELGFENVGLTYTNNSTAGTNTLTFNPGTWSFASPQKLMANFPVSIKKIYYKPLSPIAPSNTNIKELLRGALMIDVVANLTDDIGGSTTLGAAFAVDFNTSTIKFTPAFKGVFIDSIEVHADLQAVKIDGALVMYDHDVTFGDGFKATLQVTFTAITLQVSALVQFGNTTFMNNNQYYRYWRVETDCLFSPGIPIYPGVGIYGFGGGAFYNMKADSLISTTNSGSYAYTFVPKKSDFGFMVKVTLGTVPKVETFNADVSLMAEFNQNTHGLELIDFMGNFWLATKLTDRAHSKMYGGVNVSYNFPDKLFNLSSQLMIDVTENGTSVIKTPTPVGFVLNIDGRHNLWYFKFGTPSSPNNVDVFSLNLYSYLMFGNDIPVPNGFTTKFKNDYFAAIGSYPTLGGNVGTGGVGNDSNTGKGIATGVGIKFDKSYNENVYKGLCRQWSIAAALQVGAEMNLAFMDQVGCPGINGYRASGNIGLYFNLTTTITGASFHPKLCSNISSNLFTVKIGAWLSGEFPNPVYVYGSVGGEIGIFSDLVHVRFDKSFTYGSSCAGTTVTTVNAAQQDKAADLQNKLIQYIAPSSAYNFPVSSPVNVKYTLVPDEVFDVSENEGDGTVKDRTFKLSVTTNMEIKNSNGTWSPVAIQSRVNNIGENQYFNSGTTNLLTTGVTLATGQLSQTTASLVNTNTGNTLLAANHLAAIITYPVPPPPPPVYPNPIPDPVNHLTINKDYRFTVTAVLKEGVTTGNTIVWSTAKTRANLPVTETKVFSFSTGGMTAAQVSNVVPQSR